MSGDARNLADLVRDAAERDGAKNALIDGATSVTWAELDEQVSRFAGGLVARGLPTAARVGILMPNSIDFALAYFGLLRAGLVAMPLNPGYTAAELAYQLADSGAELVLTTEALAGNISDVDVVMAGTADWDALAGSDPIAASVGGDNDLAVLLYTSGTTGRPKGAMLTHRALAANVQQLGRIQPPVVASDDIVLLVLPLFHVYGLNAGLGMTAYAGATGVLADRFDPVDTLALVREREVSNLIGAPPMYVAWTMLPEVAESMSTLRLAVSGAAPLPPEVLQRFLELTGHHIFEGYGLTETAPVLTSTLCSTVAKPGSIGRPIPGVDLRIVGEDGTEVDEDDPGEVVVRGPNVFSGYWPDGADGPDDSGWFPTGDVAYADDDGDLFLVDRIRELILVSGFNVYPREVEDVLATHPDIDEVAIVGVPHPYTGESVRALVVPSSDALTADDVIEFAAARLARFKCPTSVEFVSELPKSVAGKVAKGKLRQS